MNNVTSTVLSDNKIMIHLVAHTFHDKLMKLFSFCMFTLSVNDLKFASS